MSIIDFESGDEVKDAINQGRITFDGSLGMTGHRWYALYSCGGIRVRHIFSSKAALNAFIHSQREAFDKDEENGEKNFTVTDWEFQKFELAIKKLYFYAHEQRIERVLKGYMVEIEKESAGAPPREARDHGPARVKGGGNDETSGGMYINDGIIVIEYLTGKEKPAKAFFNKNIVTYTDPVEKAPKKWYAVIEKNGAPINHIFCDWKSCKEFIEEESAIYKGFSTLKEAGGFLLDPDMEWLKKCRFRLKKEKEKEEAAKRETASFSAKIKGLKDKIETGHDIPLLGTGPPLRADNRDPGLKEGKLVAYVKGSFDGDKEMYGSGVFMKNENGTFEKRFSYGIYDSINAPLKEKAGELQAAMIASDYAVRHNSSGLVIYYDYKGVECFVTGKWEADKEQFIEYSDFIRNAMKRLKIEFVMAEAGEEEAGAKIASALASEMAIKIRRG